MDPYKYIKNKIPGLGFILLLKMELSILDYSLDNHQTYLQITKVKKHNFFVEPNKV